MAGLTVKSFLGFSILTVTFGLSGCDKVKSLIEKEPTCGDPSTLTRVQSEFQKGVLSATKQYIELDDSQVNLDAVRGIVADFKPDIEDIRTQPDRHSCVATLKLTISSQRFDHADAIRQARGDSPLKAALFEQDLTLENHTLRQSLEYQLEPTDDGKKMLVTLKNSRGLQKFLAQLAVDASQPVPIDSEESSIVASSVVIDELASDTATKAIPPVLPQPNMTGDTDDTVTSDMPHHDEPTELPVITHDTDNSDDEIDDTDKILLATEQARTRLSVKRKQFNDMWSSASPEAQQSLTDDQKQWVKERDSTCQNEADMASLGYEEVVRMQCITRMLSERYSEVKEYFDNYE